MNHRQPLCRVLILTTSLLASVAGYAQQQDIRLSPADPPIYTFHDPAKIQSAASIGGTTLVAWGTTVRGSDSIIRPALVMQIVQDGAAIGSPQQIHDSAGRPYRTVAVVGLDSLFLVLWNDARSGAPGIYARRVDRAGEFVGGETLLVPGRTMDADTSVWLHRRPDGYTLYWAEARDGEIYHYSQEIDPDGAFVGISARVATINFDNDLYYSQFPGARIDRDSLWFYHADGRRDPRRIPEGHLRRPHYLNGDTSVVVMNHDAIASVRLVFYRSLFDTTEVRSLTLHPMLHPILPAELLKTAGALTRDTAGNYQFVFAVKRSYSYGLSSGGAGIFAEFFRATIINDSLHLDTAAIARFAIGSYQLSGSRSANVIIRGQRYDAGDENCSRPVVGYESTSYDGSVTTNLIDSVRVTVDGHSRSPCCDSIAEWIMSNDLRISPSLLWIAQVGYSAISVARGSDTTLLSTPVAFQKRGVPHRTPGISLSHGKLVVSYQKHVQVPAFICGEIDFSRDSALSITPPLLVPPVIPGSFREDLTGNLFHASGGSIVYYRSVKTYIEASGVRHHSGGAVRVYSATDTGWRVSLQESIWYPPVVRACLYDPNDKQLLLSLYVNRYENVLWGIDAADTLRWKQTGLLGFENEAVTFIPDGFKSYLRVNGNNAQRVKYVSDSNSTTSSFTLRPSVDTVATRYQRLRGDRFLRICPASQLAGGRLTDSLLQLEVYELGGRLVDSAIVRAASSEYNFAVVEHPDYSPMVLLFGADDGVHLTLIDRSLKSLIVDTIISSARVRATAPHGVFRGDTLYIVWEDYRDGGKDIYANRWVLPEQYHLLGATRSSHIPILGITPNPATSTVIIDALLRRPGEFTIEFIDEMGRLVRSDDLGQLKAGDTHLQVSVADLHPGAYTVVVKSSGQSVTGRLIVLH